MALFGTEGSGTARESEMKKHRILSILATVMSTAGVASAVVTDSTTFINEFHYDNTGGDVVEFVEIAIPTVGGSLTGLSVVLYNGTGGASYDTLSTFVLGSVGPNFTLYTLDATGIQNGSPDGIALVQSGSVLEFLSYEGSFVATNGPATGLTSTDVGPSEPGTALGTSLGLTGTGNSRLDFTYMLFTDDTPGAVNTSQTFTAPAVVPLPPAAVAGVVLLGSTGIDKLLRRRSGIAMA